MSDEIRIILAEDSLTVRRYLASIIEETPGMRVIGEARNGAEAVKMVLSLKPDVVSMDINMPEVDGLEATRQIMAQCPTPVVVVTGLLDIDVHLSMQALEAGALAVVGKPPDRKHPDFFNKRRLLINTLRAMADVKVISRRHYPSTGAVSVPRLSTRPQLVALGASTGGPSALYTVLQALPPHFSVPVVIAQHMPYEFISGLVRWLDAASHLTVQMAQQGMILQPGTVTVAPAPFHMAVRRSHDQLAVRLLEDSGQSRYQPSIDILFESVAHTCGHAAIGIILTGMGDDGARGLLAMREVGGYTLVQDEISSTVYGMPRAAVDLGAAVDIVPLAQIGIKIGKMI